MRSIASSKTEIASEVERVNATLVNLEGLANRQWQTFHLPNKPGKYRVYVTTHRVFERDIDKNPYHDRGFPVSSNILDLQVR